MKELEQKFSSDLEIPKYLKRKENKIHTSLNSYCIICGKIDDKMKNSIVIDYMQKVDTPMGKRYIQISEDVLYETYRGKLSVFFVEDIYKDKCVNLHNTNSVKRDEENIEVKNV